MERANKEVVRRYIEEMFNGQRFELIDQLLASDVIAHGGDGSVARGNQNVRRAIPAIRTALPDAHLTIEEMVADGDRVVVRLRGRGTQKGPIWGIEPSGRRLDIPEWFWFRLAEGKIAEYWYLRDHAEARRQLQAQ